jgi:hypothetical protein
MRNTSNICIKVAFTKYRYLLRVGLNEFNALPASYEFKLICESKLAIIHQKVLYMIMYSCH